MRKGLARFLGVLFVIGAIGAILRQPPWLLLLLGIGFGLVAFAFGWFKQQTMMFTAKQLSSKPFEGQLPLELGKATETAIALGGDDSYSQKVVGEKAYAANFEDLRKYAEYEDGSMLEVQCCLVCEPANPYSSHAVAVTCGGVVLGYIAEFESEPLYNFLMLHRGMGRVNSNVYFSIADEMSHVELDLERPYRIVAGV
ncbi:MAG: hypothetical protein ACKOWE_01205 [Micrococcales bacterium]